MQVSITTPVATWTSFPTISIPRPFPPPFSPALLFAKVASPSMPISDTKASIAPEGTIYEDECVDGCVGGWVGICRSPRYLTSSVQDAAHNRTEPPVREKQKGQSACAERENIGTDLPTRGRRKERPPTATSIFEPPLWCITQACVYHKHV